jgi:hypothetical protein
MDCAGRHQTSRSEKFHTEKDGSIQRHRRCPEVDFRAADEPFACSPQPVPPPRLRRLPRTGMPAPLPATPTASVRHLMPGSKLATFHGAPAACSVLRFRGPLPRSLAVRVRRVSQPLRALNDLSCFRGAVDCRSRRHRRQPWVWLLVSKLGNSCHLCLLDAG